jgi:xylulokinase
MYLLGLDVGTSSCKSTIFQDGKTVSSGYREYAEYNPQPTWTELNPDEVWNKVKECIKESIKAVDEEEIRALSLSVLGEAVFPINKRGNWLYPAITAYDARANGYKNILDMWKQKLGIMQLFRLSGIPLNSMPSVNKILWIRENKPQIYEKTWKFVCFEDYLIFKLSGEVAIDYSLASRTMMLDIRKKRWSTEILEAVDLNADMLSDAYSSGTKVGEISSKASKETSLKKGTSVVTGGHDQSCGALGVGVTREGPTMDATGSVECIASVMKIPILTEEMLKSNQCCHCHVVKDSYITLGFFPSAGLVFRWYRDLFAEKEKEVTQRNGKNIYAILTGMATKSPPGASRLLLLPHFIGSGTGASPSMNRNSRGAIIGLSLFHKKSDIIRTILEGITFELRQIMEFFEKVGIRISDLRAIGGGAKSPFWLQLKADVTNRKVILPEVTEAASLGAAILAGKGIKRYKSFDDAVAETYREKSVYHPNSQVNKYYNKQYAVYKKVYPALIDIFNDLAKI